MNTTAKNIRVFLVDGYKSFAEGLATFLDTNKPVMEVVGIAHNKGGISLNCRS